VRRCCQEVKADLHSLLTAGDLQTGHLGFEPSREALGRCRTDVASALLALRMRTDYTAIALNQDWARTGNIFPYFSPVLPARACLARTGFEFGASAEMSCPADSGALDLVVEPTDSPWQDAYPGWVLGSGAFVDRVRAMAHGQLHRERRRESRLIAEVPLEGVCDAACSTYRIPGTELNYRGRRHPARVALVYSAPHRTTATNAELVGLLGLSRPESVPNLTPRFSEKAGQIRFW
jgi:hypothetical protein